MKEVDWCKAPEGATHYNAACPHPWLKDVPVSFYYGGWIEYSSNKCAMEDLKNAVKRPQEWDGEGLPPVGTICMLNEGRDMNAYYAHHAGKKLKIVAHTTSSKGDILAVYMVIGGDEFHGLCDNLNFAPIKTPEQLAAEERLHAIDEMVDLAQRSDSIFTDVMMSALYDAGYRKTETKK